MGEAGTRGLYPSPTGMPRWDMRRLALLLVFAFGLSGCAHAVNFTEATGPRYAGNHAADPRPETLRVVSFNVKFARHVDALVQLLRYEPRLAGADVIALQEMDATGVSRAAQALHLNYVYYPAVVHPADHKEFGNAVLSPWPIESDHKIVLPHLARFRRQQRIAVAADVRVRERRVRVYSVHLETPAGLSKRDRVEQVQAILDDARATTDPVVIAGDFNGRSVVADTFPAAGFLWVTEGVGRTISLFSWDHVLARGLALTESGGVGTVRDNWGASDHRPVWAELVFAPS
jgi:endonuclease/exonuclease/phosphatase family metal-dependent hydrolase